MTRSLVFIKPESKLLKDLQSDTKRITNSQEFRSGFGNPEQQDFSLKSIGYHFGGRDHSTVIHAIQSVSDFIKEKKEMKGHVDTIRRNLER